MNRVLGNGARRLVAIPCVLLLSLLGPDLAPAGTTQEQEPPRVPGYLRVLEWVRGQCDRMTTDLETAHVALLARAEREDPELARRLAPPPPAGRPPGYGVIPEVLADAPLQSVNPRETRYTVDSLSTMFTASIRDAAVLAARAAGDPGLSLADAVVTYERLRTNRNRLDKHIAYHEFWQKDVAQRRRWYEGRNEVVALVREREQLRRSGEDPARVATLDRRIRDAVAPFRRREGLAIEKLESGMRVLRVRVHTDVQSEELLRAFQEGVQTAWSDCEAARERQFRVDLEVVRVPPSALYPEGPPPHGSPLDLDRHLARFPATGLVLTTGATSLHAGERHVQLGPATVTPRVLAHEFGHLLGFADAYLRGFEGDPDGPYGACIIEWTGLVGDLMGNPGVGEVSVALIDRLLEEYQVK